MNREKVVFSFFMILALTLNYGFYAGEVDNPSHHNVYELFAVVIVNMIATVLKFGDRSQMGAMLLATSLVALVQLFSASIVWTYVVNIQGDVMTPNTMSTIISLSGGALIANFISVILLIIETSMMRH
jgi:Ca2+/H+ antiporter, TMEM165/GDT1 family